MTGNYFAVDTDALAQASPQVRLLAQRVKRLGFDLDSGLNQLGECWGNDKGGQQFAKQYLKPRTQLVIGCKKGAEVLDSIADGISTLAKGFRKTEEQAIEAAGYLKKDIGSLSKSRK